MQPTTVETWKQAVAAVAGGMSLRQAYLRFKLSGVYALRQRCIGQTPLNATRGRRFKYLTAAAEVGVFGVIIFISRHFHNNIRNSTATCQNRMK